MILNTLHNINVLGNDSDVDGSLDESSIEIVALLQGIAIASQGVGLHLMPIAMARIRLPIG